MAHRIALSRLNTSSVDILNTIRANASYEYQQNVPEITTVHEIPKVGEVLFGYPQLANEFVNSMVNRIGLVIARSAIFNNPLNIFKKGELSFGESIEEAFIGLTKAKIYAPQDSYKDELKRTPADVKVSFHVRNWRTRYPLTIMKEELKKAFLSEEGVVEFISKMMNSIYVSAEYDEWLLMKWMLIKNITKGRLKPIAFDADDMKDGAVKFRSMANRLPFMSNEYNEAGVLTTTPKENIHILMSADFNAKFDVDVLSSAFNMDRATFLGQLSIVDDWTTFDNDRFADIVSDSDMFEPVTSEELALMADVRAVMVDPEWFQIYDTLFEMSEPVYSRTGLYWNYNLHVHKIISRSIYSNALVFVDDGATISAPTSLTAKIASVESYDGGTIWTLDIVESATLQNMSGKWLQTQADVTAGLAVLPQGGFIIPTAVTSMGATNLVYQIGDVLYAPASGKTVSTAKVGDTITLAKQE